MMWKNYVPKIEAQKTIFYLQLAEEKKTLK